jgi:hypothetical protein
MLAAERRPKLHIAPPAGDYSAGWGELQNEKRPELKTKAEARPERTRTSAMSIPTVNSSIARNGVAVSPLMEMEQQRRPAEVLHVKKV